MAANRSERGVRLENLWLYGFSSAAVIATVTAGILVTRDYPPTPEQITGAMYCLIAAAGSGVTAIGGWIYIGSR